MVTLNWDSKSKIKSGGFDREDFEWGILAGGFLTELESNFYVTKVVLDADYDKTNENFLRSTFKPIVWPYKGLKFVKRV